MKEKDKTTVKLFAQYFGPFKVSLFLVLCILWPICLFLSGEPVVVLWIDILFEFGLVIYLVVVIFFKNYLTIVTITPEYIRVKNKEYKWDEIYITVRSRFYNRGQMYYAYFCDKYLTIEETNKSQHRKNGTYMLLYTKRTQLLLQHYTKTVKVLSEPLGFVEKAIWDVIQEHNAKVTETEILSNQ